MRVTIVGFLALTALFFFGCKKAEKQAEEDDQLIREYLEDSGLTAVKDPSGLYYIIEQQGTGPECNANSDVTVAYTGYFLDGQIFDGSDQQGVTFNLSGVIEGWKIGIPFFREGGTGKLLIPSALGYGSSNTGSIPANSVLIFDVTLVDVL